jgi:hypothetical protein
MINPYGKGIPNSGNADTDWVRALIKLYRKSSDQSRQRTRPKAHSIKVVVIQDHQRHGQLVYQQVSLFDRDASDAARGPKLPNSYRCQAQLVVV